MPINPNYLGKLLDRYWPVLVQWIGGSRNGAEDIVQAAFIKLAAEEPPPTNCVAWLFTVTKRLAINEKVSQAKRRTRETRFETQNSQQTRTSDELELRDLLDILDDRERKVVIAKIWGELTFDQIATVCGESKASVWRTYQHGISKLKEAYRECSDE